MKNDGRQRYVSRKELAERFDRSYSWAKALAKDLPNYGERFDFDEAKRKLQAGYRPMRRSG